MTQRAVLDALEALYPALGGTIRDHVTQAAPTLPALLRLSIGPVPRAAGRPVTRGGGVRSRTVSLSWERLPGVSTKLQKSAQPLPDGRGFHEKAAPCQARCFVFADR